MKTIQNKIMNLAVVFMPKDQDSWSRAMKAEYTQITDERQRLTFALGCLKVSISRAAQTRRGLSVIGRGIVAMGLAAFSLYGVFILFAVSQFSAPELVPLFTALCFFYAGAAAMTVLSLKGLRLYASVGFAAAVIMVAALKITKFETPEISNIYLQALSFEWGVANTALIVAAIYLSLINAKDEAVL